MLIKWVKKLFTRKPKPVVNKLWPLTGDKVSAETLAWVRKSNS